MRDLRSDDGTIGREEDANIDDAFFMVDAHVFRIRWLHEPHNVSGNVGLRAASRSLRPRRRGRRGLRGNEKDSEHHYIPVP
jgi:hypothetical protein